MEIAVWDTYVTRKDGKEMHFDIYVPSALDDIGKIMDFGLEYLQTRPFETWGLSSSKCTFCHVEENKAQSVIESIKNNGYAIQEIKNCE